MSFFCDVLNYFDLKDIKNNVLVSFIPEIGAVIYGALKIKNISEDLLVFDYKNKEIVVAGCGLKIDTISKGEVVIIGEINDIKYGE